MTQACSVGTVISIGRSAAPSMTEQTILEDANGGMQAALQQSNTDVI